VRGATVRGWLDEMPWFDLASEYKKGSIIAASDAKSPDCASLLTERPSDGKSVYRSRPVVISCDPETALGGPTSVFGDRPHRRSFAGRISTVAAAAGLGWRRSHAPRDRPRHRRRDWIMNSFPRARVHYTTFRERFAQREERR